MNRRQFFQFSCGVMALVALPYLAGCGKFSQTQLEALVNTIAASLAQILPYFQSVSPQLAANIEAGLKALEAAVQAWTPGSPITDIEQIVNDIVSNLNLIPVAAPYQPLVALIVATAEGIVTLLTPANKMAVVPATGPHSIAAEQAPKTAKAYRARWNQLAAQDPATAKLKLP